MGIELLREAAVWSRGAPELENANAMLVLFALYLVKGAGVTQDFDEAKKWLNEAEKYGDEELKEKVKEIKAGLAGLESE